MDEVKYENRYTMDDTIVREFHKYVLTRNPRKVGFIAIGCSLVAWLAFAILWFGLGYNFDKLSMVILIEFAGLSLILGGMLTSYYHLTAFIAVRQDRRDMGGTIPETIVQFSDEDVTISELGKIRTFGYMEIYKVFETEHVYALMVGKFAAVVVAKGCFSYGDEDKFEEYVVDRLNAYRRQVV